MYLFSKKTIFRNYDWSACLHALLFEAKKEYSDAENIFLVAGMNFNCVYKEISKDIPFILVLETVECRDVEPEFSSMCSSPRLSIYVFVFLC